MTLKISEIILNKEQESEILKNAETSGYSILVFKNDGSIRIQKGEIESLKDDEIGASTVDLTPDYYDNVVRWLGDNDVSVSDEMVEKIGKIRESESLVEEEEYEKAVEKAGLLTKKVLEDIKAKVEDELKKDLTPKMRNDYRAILRRIEKTDYDMEYINKWNLRLLGVNSSNDYEAKLKAIEMDYKDNLFTYRLYNRIFVDDLAYIERGEELKWVKLNKQAL
jgi:hypothetical protein